MRTLTIPRGGKVGATAAPFSLLQTLGENITTPAEFFGIHTDLSAIASIDVNSYNYVRTVDFVLAPESVGVFPTLCYWAHLAPTEGVLDPTAIGLFDALITYLKTRGKKLMHVMNGTPWYGVDMVWFNSIKTWAASTTLATGAVRRPTANSTTNYAQAPALYRLVYAGTTAATEPNWNRQSQLGNQIGGRDNTIGNFQAATQAGFPATGSTSVVYIATSTSTFYRWDGSAYVTVSSGYQGLNVVVDGTCLWALMGDPNNLTTTAMPADPQKTREYYELLFNHTNTGTGRYVVGQANNGIDIMEGGNNEPHPRQNMSGFYWGSAVGLTNSVYSLTLAKDTVAPTIAIHSSGFTNYNNYAEATVPFLNAQTTNVDTRQEPGGYGVAALPDCYQAAVNNCKAGLSATATYYVNMVTQVNTHNYNHMAFSKTDVAGVGVVHQIIDIAGSSGFTIPALKTALATLAAGNKSSMDIGISEHWIDGAGPAYSTQAAAWLALSSAVRYDLWMSFYLVCGALGAKCYFDYGTKFGEIHQARKDFLSLYANKAYKLEAYQDGTGRFKVTSNLGVVSIYQGKLS